MKCSAIVPFVKRYSSFELALLPFENHLALCGEAVCTFYWFRIFLRFGPVLWAEKKSYISFWNIIWVGDSKGVWDSIVVIPLPSDGSYFDIVVPRAPESLYDSMTISEWSDEIIWVVWDTCGASVVVDPKGSWVCVKMDGSLCDRCRQWLDGVCHGIQYRCVTYDSFGRTSYVVAMLDRNVPGWLYGVETWFDVVKTFFCVNFVTLFFASLSHFGPRGFRKWSHFLSMRRWHKNSTM